VTIVSAVIAFGLGLLLWKVVFQTPKKTPGRPPLRVNKRGEEGAFKTIKKALERAKPGDLIVIEGGVYPEQLDLHKQRGITIEAGEGEVVVQPPPHLKKNRKLLEMYDCDNVHIKGIQFNGKGKMQTLVSIGGTCPGLVLDRVRLEQFTRTAVQITNCSGAKDQGVQPLQLRHLQIMSPNLKEPGPAITFGLHAQIVWPKLNDHIHIVDCKFNGKLLTPNMVAFGKKFLGEDVKLNGESLLDLR